MYKHYERSDSRLDMAQETVEQALKIDPDLPEAHLALGQYYYLCHRDYDQALKQFAIARKSLPDNVELLYFIGLVQRRQGKFEQGLANIKKAYELDPLSSNVVLEIGLSYMFHRNYPQAARYCEDSISLAPDSPKAYNVLAQIHLRWQANTHKARQILEDALKNVKGVEYPRIIQSLVNLDIYERNYHDALDNLSLISEDVDQAGFFFPKALRVAQIYEYMNNVDTAKKYYNDARIFLESKIDEQPGDPQFHSLLGIVYAALGKKEKALREGKRAVEILPVSRESVHGPLLVKNLARIYVILGKYDAAIEKIEYLLSIHGELWLPLLQLDPAWDPLREHPRFISMIQQDHLKK
jgi:tetratricopeptide (TPR) repeat protein